MSGKSFIVNTWNFVPSDPSIEWCPAAASDKEFIVRCANVELTIFEEPKHASNGDKVSGVLGPIACDQCAFMCKDAYTMLYTGSEGIDRAIAEAKSASTPVEIRLLSDAPPDHSREKSDIERDLKELSRAGTLLILDGEPLLISQE